MGSLSDFNEQEYWSPYGPEGNNQGGGYNPHESGGERARRREQRYGQVPYQNGTGGPAPDPRWNYGDPNAPLLSGRLQDSWGRLLDSIRHGRTGNQTLEDILANFKGTEGDLQRVMEHPAYRQAVAFGAKSTKAYKDLEGMRERIADVRNVGLGQIAAGGARATQESLRALDASGLGRNVGAKAAIQQQGNLDTAGRSALYSAAMLQNELGYLDNMMDLENQMTQLALGFNPQPRQSGGGGSGAGDWIALAGTLAGAALGSPWLGSAIGAIGSVK